MYCMFCGASLTYTHSIDIDAARGVHSHRNASVCLSCLEKTSVLGRLMGVNAGQNGG